MGGKILVTLGFFPSCLFDLFASLEHKGIKLVQYKTLGK